MLSQHQRAVGRHLTLAASWAPRASARLLAGLRQREVLRRLEGRKAEPVGEFEALEVREGQQHEAVEQRRVR